MAKILLKISYFGKNYCGWQFQINGNTVQREMSIAVRTCYGTEVAVSGCSRTDSGVHALRYYCTLTLPEGSPNIPLNKLPTALNVRLPLDITVLEASKVDDDFHPRYSAISKTYEYRMYDSDHRDPFLDGRAWHVGWKLNEEVMNRNARDFIGSHDFTSFMASGSEITDTVREIYEASVTRENGIIVFRVCGNGFLYNMVRIMAGTLMDISCGRLKDGGITDIIASKDRFTAGRTAPPEGLYLVDVEY